MARPVSGLSVMRQSPAPQLGSTFRPDWMKETKRLGVTSEPEG